MDREIRRNRRMELPRTRRQGGRDMSDVDFITHGGKVHVIFGVSCTRKTVTYCGLRWNDGHQPSRKHRHCKNCTRELRRAGMTWRWYEKQKYTTKEAAI